MKLKLRVGFEHTRAVQDFASLLKIASMALGGGGEAEQKISSPQTFAEAQAQFAAVCGGH